MTSTEWLISHYGLLGVFVGGLLEGETVLILAAVAAHQGLLSLSHIFLVGAGGAIVADQAWFVLARRRPQVSLVQRVGAEPRVRKALGYIERHPTLFILSFRFLYGLRIAGAIACGLSKVPAAQFVILNAIAALIWTVTMLALGYAFGTAIQAVLGQFAHFEWKIIAAAGVIALLFLVIHRFETRWQP